MYIKIIDYARKAVAIAMLVCGVGLVICSNRNDYLTETLRREAGKWAWGELAFGIGVLICLIATLAFIIEYLARPAAPESIRFRSLFIRSMVIIIAIVAIYYSMDIFYGLAKGIGATIGTILVLAALKNDNPARAVLAVLALIVLGPTLLSTQSAYQYARRHADEIVSAGCELMDQWPETNFIKEVNITDKHVPSILLIMGARSILVHKESVSIYVPGRIPGINDREFIIYKISNPTIMRESVFIKRPSNKDEMCKIGDRLWMTDY